MNFEEVDIHPEETWEVYFIDDDLDKVEGDGYSVESFFRYDWKPLQREEVDHALKMLAWSRMDLQKTISRLSPEKLEATYPSERWNIHGILGHIAGAEWWYLDRLSLAFPKADLSKDPQIRLDQSRTLLVNCLPKLVGVSQVVGLDGEFWSPRKVLRRALWHELDHIRHIQKLIQG